MDFSLSADQVAFQNSVRGSLERICPLDAIRALAAGDSSHVSRITSGLDELGLRGLLLPEAAGGLGLGVLDAVIVQEMIGRALAPGDFLSVCVVASGVLAGPAAAQGGALASALASGRMRPAIALSEYAGARAGAGVRIEEGRLFGKSLFVMDAAGASHLFLADREGGVRFLPMAAQGVRRNRLSTIDATRCFSEIIFEGAQAERLGGEHKPAAQMVMAGRLLLAADALGAMQAMLDRAVAYALERRQFGRVIGSFQAVKHMCAEMATRLEPLRALIWRAAHACEEGSEEAPLLVALAKSHAAEVGVFIARTATEVHGGMGFTDLLGLHYWFKRIGVTRQLLGSPEALRREAARLQGWTP